MATIVVRKYQVKGEPYVIEEILQWLDSILTELYPDMPLAEVHATFSSWGGGAVVVEEAKFNYQRGFAPENYVCGNCGAERCKLWRKHTDPNDLLCLECLAQKVKVDLAQVDGNGMLRTARSASPFWPYVRAVPWVGGEVPYFPVHLENDPALMWWKQLPTFPVGDYLYADD